MQSKLSIVIPVFNRADVVVHTLESVRHQSWRPLKVILVDNASTDNTLEVLEHWRQQESAPGFEIVVVSESKPGAAAARNRGLQEVTTEYTMFFDSDDLMSPRHVERAMRYLEKHDADIVGWDVNYVDFNGRTSKLKFKAKDALWHNIMHGGFATQRYIARTSLFRKAGLWNSSVAGWDDVELGVRLLVNSPVLAKVEGTPTVTVNAMENSISGRDYSSGSEKWEYALDLMEETMKHNGIGRRYADFRRIILAGNYVEEGAIEEGLRLFRSVARRECSYGYGLIYRLAFTYTAHGGRGIARIMRMFFK